MSEFDYKRRRPGRGEPFTAAPTRAVPPSQQRQQEVRLFGLNACVAMFNARPEDLRKVYLTEQRISTMKAVLAWCVKQRIGYRLVADVDLAKLTGSQHHEGVCFETRRRPLLSLAELLADQPPAPAASLLIVFDGVGNPHNFGAVLRSAANFGAGGVILTADAGLSLSGAAYRVAEGGAEAVPLAKPQFGENLIAMLRDAGYSVAATVPTGGESIYAKALPQRLALVFGAEGSGMSDALITAADHRLTIPGTGNVESLNIAASAAVILAEHWRVTHG
ncbi:MAG TPA: TrmH family RNA methyltransferase [Tahibacter sp.]|nr:TrmH family RNA methyltransferase [Tahibacter sp.]